MGDPSKGTAMIMTKHLTRAKAAHLRRLLKHSRRLTLARRIKYSRMLLAYQESKTKHEVMPAGP
jgi:hypothetical protein